MRLPERLPGTCVRLFDSGRGMGAAMELQGKNFIGGERSGSGTETFAGLNPATEAKLPPDFHNATQAETDGAVRAAEAAFVDYRGMAAEARAAFLERVGEEILALGDEVIDRAAAE